MSTEQHRFTAAQVFKRWFFDGMEVLGPRPFRRVFRLYPCQKCGLDKTAKCHRKRLR